MIFWVSVVLKRGLLSVVVTTDNSPSQNYTHPDDQTTLSDVTPGFVSLPISLRLLQRHKYHFRFLTRHLCVHSVHLSLDFLATSSTDKPRSNNRLRSVCLGHLVNSSCERIATTSIQGDFSKPFWLYIMYFTLIS